VGISLVTFILEFVIVYIHKYFVNPITGFNVVSIVRVLSMDYYYLLIGMTGVGLDSINRPKINAIKVFCYAISKRYWRFGRHFLSLNH
jgi:hypothetical protein